MKNPRFPFSAAILAVLLVAAPLRPGSALGGDSIWGGSFWDGGDGGDDTVGWGDDDDAKSIWGEGVGSGGGPALPPLPPALERFRARAEKGDPGALRDIGLAFHLGSFGLKVDYREALRWYEMAAAKGNLPAMVNLAGILMDNRIGSEGAERDRNMARAYALTRRAAEAGNVTAQLNMGKFLQLGKGVAVNEDEALWWLEKAGGQGNPEACDRVSLIYHNRGDAARAAEWFRRGAEAGDPQATFNLGVYYESGLGGLPEDQRKAFSCFLKSARRGHSMGMLVTGKRYLSGRGCRADQSRAKKWLLMAGERGESAARELLAGIPPGVEPFDDRPLRIDAASLIGDFDKNPEEAALNCDDRVFDLGGGNTSVDMKGGGTVVTVTVPGSRTSIVVDIPPDGSGAAVFRYGGGWVIRARFAEFVPETRVIRLENGRAVPEE